MENNFGTEHKKTTLHSRHVKAGAKMIPFAGYKMPVSYPSGIIQEHQHTRKHAGLFDVSHMGNILIEGEYCAEHMESLLPTDMINLPLNHLRYSLLLNKQGGIIDDLIVIRTNPQKFILTVNAACLEKDLEHFTHHLGNQLNISKVSGKTLLALQGPESASVMHRLGQDTSDMGFMTYQKMNLADITCSVSRSGYTGEDGFEISVEDCFADQLASSLLADERVKWIGIGARDSLRMEAGLNLYGQEMNESLTPLDAGVFWTISKSRRPDGERPGGFLGFESIFDAVSKPQKKRLVGLVPEGRSLVRTGTILTDAVDTRIGYVTSGGYSASLAHPICLAIIDSEHVAIGNTIYANVRDSHRAATVCSLPFVKHRYYRVPDNL
ncbi:MAG: glycine cleavage system aminomethyltransferase GcvT [Gammaproteobacteria bacterium]|nr:glycine cleavage system aminomethyltransferase GcvT [Gammaproteobacteria bacterium]